jgi:hypothetical protein
MADPTPVQMRLAAIGHSGTYASRQLVQVEFCRPRWTTPRHSRASTLCAVRRMMVVAGTS